MDEVATSSELEAFARFCEATLTTEVGAPFRLEAFQRVILADYFAGTRETVVLIPKKNGKSSLSAALALWHLLSVPFSEAIVVAAARDQAGILLRQVTGFIRRSPQLRERLKVVQREIRNERLDGRLRVLASDADTVDGQLPTLAIVDELHRHRRAELYGVLRDGLGARSGQMIAISTAGDDEESPLGRLRARAYELPGMVRDGAHRYVTTGDLAYHEWSLDPAANVDDLDLVKTANPFSGVDREELRVRHDSPSMTEWAWKRFSCGIWTSGEFSAFQIEEWQACAVTPLEVPEEALGPFVGVDVALKWDTTAIVPVWVTTGFRMQGLEERREVRPGVFEARRQVPNDESPTTVYVEAPIVFEPRGDGTAMDVTMIYETLLELAQEHPAGVFVFDPAFGGSELAQRLDAALPEVRLVEHSQHGPAMVKASARLAELISAARLRHSADETLTRHVMNCGVRQVQEGWRLAKQEGGKAPIDAAVALAMAVSVAVDAATGSEALIAPPYRRQGWGDQAERDRDEPLGQRRRYRTASWM